MTEISQGMKVAGYIRVSTPIQAASGEGLNTQKELIGKRINEKGWTLYKTYSDEGISGSKSENRPGLQQLLHDAKNGHFKAVIISRLSRFGRNAREIMNNIHILQESNITLISIKENIDFSTAYGRAMFGIFAIFAELDREIIMEQMSDSKMLKWRENRMFNGRPPYGYKWDETINKLVINAEEKEIYERIVELYLNHGMSLKDISIKLAEEGIVCKRKPFNSSTLSYILKNPAYCNNYVVNKYKYKNGKRLKEEKHNFEHISFPIEPIISKNTWDKIQKKTQFNKSKGKRISLAINLFLRDIVFCGHCGGRVRPRFGSKRKDGSAPCYYCCHWAQTSKKDRRVSGREKCLLPHIPAEKLEDQVWQRMLFHLMMRRDKYHDILNADKNYRSFVKAKMQYCKEIEDEIAKQNRVKDNIFMLLEDKNFNRVEFSSRLNVVNEKIIRLQQDYKDQQSKMLEAKELAMNIKKVKTFSRENQTQIGRELMALSTFDRKRLAENMFSKIYILKDEKNKDRFNLKYQKSAPVAVLGQLLKEGKFPSLNINGSDNFA